MLVKWVIYIRSCSTVLLQHVASTQISAIKAQTHWTRPSPMHLKISSKMWLVIVWTINRVRVTWSPKFLRWGPGYRFLCLSFSVINVLHKISRTPPSCGDSFFECIQAGRVFLPLILYKLNVTRLQSIFEPCLICIQIAEWRTGHTSRWGLRIHIFSCDGQRSDFCKYPRRFAPAVACAGSSQGTMRFLQN